MIRVSIAVIFILSLGCTGMQMQGPAPDHRVEAARDAQRRMQHRRIQEDIRGIREEID